VKVIIQRHVYSSSPAEAGIWCMRAEREVPALPHKDDWIELADGWSSTLVKESSFMADGRVIVELYREKTDSPDTLAELCRLVDEYDWEWIGSKPTRTVEP
jgi:hypothetical protein